MKYGGRKAMKIKEIVSKLMSVGIVNALALVLVVQAANQTCSWFFHQQEFPDVANKFRKH